MRGKPLLAGLAIVIIVVAVVVVLTLGGGGDEETTGELEFPIQVEGASNVGSVAIELTYDSSVLEVTTIEAGELASNAMFEYNALIAGRVLIGIVDSSGIDGDGAVAKVSFNVIDDEGTSAITLQNIEAADADTLVDILTETSEGSYEAATQSITPPVLTFNP